MNYEKNNPMLYEKIETYSKLSSALRDFCCVNTILQIEMEKI